MSQTNKRIHFLDEIRGFAIICMVFFHAFYTMAFMFGWEIGRTLLEFFMPAEAYFAAAFVLISGISSRLSRSNALRGARLAVIAALLTIVTVLLDEVFGMTGSSIYFGILHLLSAGMLFYAAVEKFAEKIPAWITAVVCGIIFAVTYNMQYGYIGIGPFLVEMPYELTRQTAFYPFFTNSAAFSSSDYFPIFPWIFMFMTGTAIGKYFKQGKIPKFFYVRHFKPFAFCGRHSLIIYLVHQPIIYVVCMAVSSIFKI